MNVLLFVLTSIMSWKAVSLFGNTAVEPYEFGL